MSGDLLQTKLYVPRVRPSLVPRPRLIEKLNTGLNGKLTLVSAPAGFGKTTLISEWVQQCDCSVAWISLDKGDNDPVRFLTYLIAALQTIQPQIGADVMPLLQSGQSMVGEEGLTAVINDITTHTENMALILDDYHVIDSSPIDNTLIFLLDHLPPQMHLVIAGRTDPTLPLPRLRSRGQLTELRADDLRFTLDETVTFLQKVMGLNLSTENVATLETRTEGWIAGLQLAALSMQALTHQAEIDTFIANFTSSHRYIMDYLTDEVLRRRPKGTKDFLLQASILDRLSSPLCNAVTERDNSQEMLESLEAANLFIVPLDIERHWYRYHHLFGELLQLQLKRTSPNLIPELHRRASAWYAENNLMSEAIAHSLAAEDFEQAAQLTEQTFLDRMGHGEDFATMLARLVALPREIVRARPRLGIMYAWMLSITLQFDAVEPCLQEVERLAGDQLPADLKLQIAQIRADQTRHRGDYETAIKLSHQVLQALPENRSFTDMQTLTGAVFNLAFAYLESGDTANAQIWFSKGLEISQAAASPHMILLAIAFLAQTYALQGQLNRAVETCRQGLTTADETARKIGHVLPAAVYVHLRLGNFLREQNKLNEAEHHLTSGIEIGQKWQIGDDTLRDGYLFLARLRQAQGEMEAAVNAIRQAEKLTLAHPAVPGFGDPVAICWAQHRLVQAVSTGEPGHLEAIKQWPDERKLQEDAPIRSLNEELAYLIWVRLLMAQNQSEKALPILEHLHKAAKIGGRTERLIDILVLQALVQQAQGESEQALTALKQSLLLAEPEEYIRTFVDKGEPMAALLRQAATQHIMPDFLRKILAVFPDLGLRTSAPKPREIYQATLVEPLSERELEVLGLIAAGLTNQEIAQQLVIAVTTAKKHVSNIIGKLEVANRTQAVTRARELGLL